MTVKSRENAFFELAIKHNVLRFGEFELKSGRISPYFFNAGFFNTGGAMAQLSEFYADAIVDSGIEFDMLFGPAYKGIPLVTGISIALHNKYNRDLPWCFNRKEAKAHGEGGSLVGSPLKGKVLVVDDVMTAGTAIRESATILEQHSATLAGVALALDRQEKGQGALSAVQEVESTLNTSVVTVASFSALIHFISDSDTAHSQHIEAMNKYRTAYGVI